ncbi:MAG: hypothetical protein R6V10_02465 [bacterium]
MKTVALVVLAVGLGGALAGVLAFYATGVLVPDVKIQAVTGGLFAVIVPLAIIIHIYPRLAGRKPDDS